MRLLATALASGVLALAPAQAAAPPTPEALQAPQQAHEADFDDLLGDWEWSAVRETPGGPLQNRGYPPRP